MRTKALKKEVPSELFNAKKQGEPRHDNVIDTHVDEDLTWD